jgi:hypothetical protein
MEPTLNPTTEPTLNPTNEPSSAPNVLNSDELTVIIVLPILCAVALCVWYIYWRNTRPQQTNQYMAPDLHGESLQLI